VDTEKRFFNPIGGFHAAQSIQPRVQARGSEIGDGTRRGHCRAPVLSLEDKMDDRRPPLEMVVAA
jgi:hypothetical protein